MSQTRLLLPVELLMSIGSLVRHTDSDLSAFALASKCLNTIATPHLYARVELVDFLSAKACLHTLSLSSAEVYNMGPPGRPGHEVVNTLIGACYSHQSESDRHTGADRLGEGGARQGPAPPEVDFLLWVLK
ncbi:hypothetical protein C8Q76DRAFT_693676 [Earliella scabrosa]|nr:hypothetical protein C8Q76DRAFT_693676 [Earliella scabrosa]